MSPRKAQTLWQHRFNLSQEKHARLHEHLVKLAETGEASDWIIAILDAALGVSSEYKASTPQVHPSERPLDRPAPTDISHQDFTPPPKVAEIMKVPAPIVEKQPVANQPGKMTPAQIIATRKAAAAEKHPIVNPLNGKNK